MPRGNRQTHEPSSFLAGDWMLSGPSFVVSGILAEWLTAYGATVATSGTKSGVRRRRKKSPESTPTNSH